MRTVAFPVEQPAGESALSDCLHTPRTSTRFRTAPIRRRIARSHRRRHGRGASARRMHHHPHARLKPEHTEQQPPGRAPSCEGWSPWPSAELSCSDDQGNGCNRLSFSFFPFPSVTDVTFYSNNL